MSGEGGTRSSAHDDGGHDHAHLADHRDADQIRDIKAGPEAGELDVSNKSEDQADEETDERNNRERLRAAFLYDHPEIAGAETGPARHEASECEH